ncbi:MAG: PhoH family protein [Verrucomicrobia bacterium]|nr:PhoH family protein [Verrucomicrobiota bacterium]MCH8511888.1 PhoH family protein [Kiritimatiellia bacterium]
MSPAKSKTKSKKLFVLDTNVILHDSSCLEHFQEHNVALPITVLEELDNFKKGNESINFHAREFVRRLDSMSGDTLFGEGIPLGKGRGTIRIAIEPEIHPKLHGLFSPNKPDHQILNVALRLADRHPGYRTILVSKDVNLRMKAKSVDLNAQDYKTDHVADISSLYTGRRIVEDVPSEVIEALYQVPFEVQADEVQVDPPLIAHENLILKNGKKSALATYDPLTHTLKRVDKRSVYGITPRNAEQTFALAALLNDDIPLVSLSGKAGTGKTLLALAASLENRRAYRQIYLARPIVPLSNKDIGYLPGEIKAKLDPYMQPMYDNLSVIQNQHHGHEKNHQGEQIRKMLEDEKLMISALSYIRGRSLNRIYFIVDEAQNLTPHEVKTIITRAGEGTKVVFTGDIFQIDHPYLDTQSNGLTYLIERMKGQKLYAHITLERGERSELSELASNLL